jgi:hypothetical protein
MSREACFTKKTHHLRLNQDSKLTHVQEDISAGNYGYSEIVYEASPKLERGDESLWTGTGGSGRPLALSRCVNIQNPSHQVLLG